MYAAMYVYLYIIATSVHELGIPHVASRKARAYTLCGPAVIDGGVRSCHFDQSDVKCMHIHTIVIAFCGQTVSTATDES